MPVIAEMAKNGRRIQVRGSEWSHISGLKKDIPGAYFSDANPRDPHWQLPLTMSTCQLLRKRYGANLVIGPNLRVWAIQEKARQEEMAALGKRGSVELIRLPKASPKLYEAIQNRPYQSVGSAFIVKGRNVFIADEPGLGKTLMALGGILEADVAGPHLVVAPKTAVESVWHPEIIRWVPDSIVITVPDGRAERDLILNKIREFSPEILASTWVVVHPAMLDTDFFWVCRECGSRTPAYGGTKELTCPHDPGQAPRTVEYLFPQLFERQWGSIIVDEAHEVLIKRNKAGTKTRRGAEEIGTHVRPDGLRIAMSGTPFRSRPHLLWGSLNWLEPKKFSSKWSLIKTYWQLGGFTGWTIGQFRVDREKMLFAELDGIMIRRTKAEVARDLPDKSYAGTPLDSNDRNSPVGVWLPMTAKQEKAHRAILESASVGLSGGLLEPVGVLAEMTRMKQFATAYGEFRADKFTPCLPSNKYEYIVELLENMGFPKDPATKLIIAGEHTQMLDLFRVQLEKKKIPCTTINGSITGRQRFDSLAEFNAPGGPQVMFLQTRTGGVAITIDSADEMIVLNRTYVADDQVQLEDRIHRVSNPRKVRYHYLGSRGSIEEGIALANYEAHRQGIKILDQRRNPDFMKRALDLTRDS